MFNRIISFFTQPLAPRDPLVATQHPRRVVMAHPNPETLGKVFEGAPGQSAKRAAQTMLYVVPEVATVTHIWAWAAENGREIPHTSMQAKIADMNRRSHKVVPPNHQAPLEPSHAM